MSFGDSNRVKVSFIQEASFGVTPVSGTWDTIRLTSEGLAHEKQTVVSEELRSDRMRADVLEVGASAGGDLNGELSFDSYSKLFEALLQGTYTEVSTVGTVTFVSDEATMASAIVAALDLGQWFRISDAGANTGIYRVASKPSGGTIKVDATFASAFAASTAVVRAKGVKNGTTSRTFSFQRHYEDLDKFFRVSGGKLNTGTLEVASGAIVTLGFGIMGKEGTYSSTTAASAIADAPDTDVMTATANVGNIYEGSYGSELATALQSISLSINNNQRQQNAVGSRTPRGIGEGSIEITGNINAYFENILLAQKFVSHTSSALSFRFTDGDGNVLIFTLPKIYYSEGNAPATGINTDVMLPLAFIGARDPATETVIRIDALAA
jgi:hypothetical protein